MHYISNIPTKKYGVYVSLHKSFQFGFKVDIYMAGTENLVCLSLPTSTKLGYP